MKTRTRSAIGRARQGRQHPPRAGGARAGGAERRRARRVRRARVRALLSAAAGRRRAVALGEPVPGPIDRCLLPRRARARRRRRAQSLRARRRARLRLLAGHRRRRHAARPDADDPHHRLSVLPRAGLLHAGRYRRAGLSDPRRRHRRRHLLRPSLSGIHARARAWPAPISSSCRRPARSTSGRRGSTRRRCGSRRSRTATSWRSAIASGERSA